MGLRPAKCGFQVGWANGANCALALSDDQIWLQCSELLVIESEERLSTLRRAGAGLVGFGGILLWIQLNSSERGQARGFVRVIARMATPDQTVPGTEREQHFRGGGQQ